MKQQLKVVSSQKKISSKKILLEIQRLCKVFPVNKKFVSVLKQIHFTVTKGEFICILGPSGCGKTTLLNILAGFIPLTSGQAMLDGRTISKPGAERCVVFQEDALFPWLTVRENIAFGMRGRMWSPKMARHETERFLSLVGLSEFGDYLPREISGGMKKRVALARVLALRPKVLLLDEPFAALDADTREEMQDLLLSLWEKFSHTVLFVTHEVQEAVILADRILRMDRAPGRIRDDIRIPLARPRVRNSYALFALCQRLFS